MRYVRRWFYCTALAAAALWLHAIASSGATLLTLFGDFDDASEVARVVDQVSLGSNAEKRAPRAHIARPLVSAAEPDGRLLLQEISTDDLGGNEIMRLLEDEIAHDTDPAAADEFLRAFGESLHTQD